MSLVRQVLVAVFLIAFIALAWFAFEHRDLILGSATTADASAAGQGGPNAANPARSGGGGAAANAGGGGRAGGGGFGGPAPVTVAAVALDSTGTDVRTIATLAAVREVTLYPEVTGVVSRLDVKPGDEVDAGDPIVEIESADQNIVVEKAKIDLQKATDARVRAEQLVKSNNAPATQLSDAQSAEKQAAIDLQSAQLELSKRTLKAPFAGKVGLIAVSVGDLINSQKAITTLDDLSTLIVNFDVPQRVAALIALGVPVTAASEAAPGQTFSGKITAVDSRVDPDSRTLKVEASLSNESGILKPGMAVTAQLSFPGDPHPSVPSLSVQWDRKGSFVWKVADQAVHRVPVQIVTRHSGVVTVAGDLQKGDTVVVEGVLRLREGGKVNILGGDGNSAAPAKPAAAPETPVANEIGKSPAALGPAEAAAAPKT